MRFIKKYMKFLIFIGIILVIMLSPIKTILLEMDLPERIKSISGSPVAPFIYAGLYMLGVVLAFPGLPLTVLSGALFGFGIGTLVTIVGSNLGTQLTFLISRYFGGELLPFLTRRYPYLKVMDQKLKHNGFRVMVTLRLLPLVPFNAINYLAGLTSVSYKDYSMGNLIGMLPGSMLYVYFGATAIESQDNPIGLILSITLLLLFTGVSAVIKKKQDKKAVDFNDDGEVVESHE